MNISIFDLITRNDILKEVSYLASKTKNSFIISNQSVEKSPCINCVTSRILSSDFFEKEDYEILSNVEIDTILGRFENNLVNGIEDFCLYEFDLNDEIISIHYVLPVPGCVCNIKV